MKRHNKKTVKKNLRQRWYIAAALAVVVLSLLAIRSVQTSKSKVYAEVMSPCTGPLVTLTGTTTAKYEKKLVSNGTTFSRVSWYSDAVGNTTGTAFYAGEYDPHPDEVCILGGVVNGHIPLDWNWTVTHDYGGAGDRLVFTKQATVDGTRIHNVEDGVKWRERVVSGTEIVPYLNTAKFMIRNTYMSGIRDDAVENDDFLSGTVEDSLFDGIWTFMSEQLQNPGPNTTLGTDEDQYINVNRVFVRLYTTNGGEIGGGKWFKWQGDTQPQHKLRITDSVFAVDKQPRSGWSSLSIPAGTAWFGTNYILWLGEAGQYGGPKPSGVIFMEGQQARDKWNQVRNAWLSAHGYQPRPADDWNSMDDPVVAPGSPAITPTPTSAPVSSTPTPSPVSSFTCPPAGSATGGIASYSVDLPQPGNYKVWVQMMGAGDGANSLWLQFDQLYCVKVGDMAGMPTGVWEWVDYMNGNTTQKIPVPIIAAGTHTIKLIGNAAEPGVSVDRMLLTKDMACIPSGNGDACIGIVSTPTPTTQPTQTPTAIPAAATLTPTPTPQSATSPTIKTSSLPRGNKNSLYSTTVVATDPTPSDILTMTATGLPSTLTLNSCVTSGTGFGGVTLTCVVSGVPGSKGTFYPEFSVSDSSAHKASRSLRLQVR